MSILIKGMDKPTDCGLCPFGEFGYCKVKGERNTSESGVDADCPLVAIKDLTEEEVDSMLVRMMMADRKTEPKTCEECEHWNDTEDGCADRHGCRATTEDSSTVPTSSKMEQVEDEPMKTTDYCDICNHKGCRNCIANNLDDYCVPSGYEPITKAETQNSNLTFEKRCKGCKHYKLTCDLFSEVCKYEPKDEPQTERSACDTCQWYNSGIPCGVEPSVCKRAVEDEPQTE